MAKFKNGNLIIDEDKKATIGSLDITEDSFDEVLIEAENYIDTNDNTNASNIESNIHFRLGNSRFVTSDSTANSGEILLVDATSGEVTITVIPENHARVTIKKIDASANKVNITSASGLIEGEAIYSLEEQYNSIKISCDGTDWWIVGSGAKENQFIFQIYINTPKTFHIPEFGGSSYNHDFTVDWGDGSPKSHVTGLNGDPNRDHFYDSIGTYNITMTGLCEWFGGNFFYANASDFRKILKVDNLGFKHIWFYNCNNLNSTVPFGKLSSLTSVVNLFNGCISLSLIPYNIFYKCPNIIHFSGIFSNTSIISIPEDLFKFNIAATHFNGAFSQCGGITTIPENLFRYNINAINFSSVFSNNSAITSLPPNLFLYNIAAVNFEFAFSNCTNMTGSGLAIINNTALPGHTTPTATNDCFFNCTSLSDYATIPAAWK